MDAYVIDTHALIWHLQNSTRLSSRARELLVQVDQGRAVAIIPTIVLVEMIYLAEKHRIPEDMVASVIQMLSTMGGNYRLALLDLTVVQYLRQISRSVVPDMPNRIIAATALALDIPLLSRDDKIIHLANVQVVW
jgi:PIN domain nuclease of toxin-antitoxin system